MYLHHISCQGAKYRQFASDSVLSATMHPSLHHMNRHHFFIQQLTRSQARADRTADLRRRLSRLLALKVTTPPSWDTTSSPFPDAASIQRKTYPSKVLGRGNNRVFLRGSKRSRHDLDVTSASDLNLAIGS